MKSIAVIDVGGSSIKFGTWNGTSLTKLNAWPTPSDLDGFYQLLHTQVEQIKQSWPIVGVGISIPGSVNKQSGQIEGSSALDYIHFFDIHSALVQLFGLPVTLENDANCAALAEVTDGAGRDVSNMLFMVIGTGIGGAVIVDNHIWHGKHLFGGEFGYMLIDESHILSELGSPVKVARRYTKARNDGHKYSGKQVFELADRGDQLAIKQVDTMYSALGRALFNLQYSFDPEKIVIGGAISNNPELIERLYEKVAECRATSKIGLIMPDLAKCQYTDAANLRGAAVDFEKTYPHLVNV